jgi:hypothetical protein
MTANSISAHVIHAAKFVQRHHSHLSLDHPAMEMAAAARFVSTGQTGGRHV